MLVSMLQHSGLKRQHEVQNVISTRKHKAQTELLLKDLLYYVIHISTTVARVQITIAKHKCNVSAVTLSKSYTSHSICGKEYDLSLPFTERGLPDSLASTSHGQVTFPGSNSWMPSPANPMLSSPTLSGFLSTPLSWL